MFLQELKYINFIVVSEASFLCGGQIILIQIMVRLGRVLIHRQRAEINAFLCWFCSFLGNFMNWFIFLLHLCSSFDCKIMFVLNVALVDVFTTNLELFSPIYVSLIFVCEDICVLNVGLVYLFTRNLEQNPCIQCQRKKFGS